MWSDYPPEGANIEYRRISPHAARRISPFAIVSPLAEIGEGTIVEPFAIIGDNVRIGSNNYIGPHCIIGDLPEKRGYFAPQKGWKVIIGEGNRFTKQVTIDNGSEGITKIGNDCLFLKNAHVGHDCQIRDEVNLACNVVLGGFTTVGKMSRFGLGAISHPRSTIGNFCMIGANAFVKGEIKDRELWAGVPARFKKINKIS